MLANCLHDLAALGPGGVPAVALALFLAGLAGGVTHCAGMCAPFVLAQAGARAERGDGGVLARLSGAALLPYHLGRMLGYAALGAVAGGTAGLLSQISGLRWLLAGFLLTAAVLMAIQAVGRLPALVTALFPALFKVPMPVSQHGLPQSHISFGSTASRPLSRGPHPSPPPLARERESGRAQKTPSPALAGEGWGGGRATSEARPIAEGAACESGSARGGGHGLGFIGPLLASPTGLRGVALGLALSALPCGLLYAALAGAAATGSALAGAIAMAAFVVGTVPALVGVAWLGRLFLRRAGPGLRTAGAALFALNALILAGMAWRVIA